MKNKQAIVLTFGLIGLLASCGTVAPSSSNAGASSPLAFSSSSAPSSSSSQGVCEPDSNGGTSLPAQTSKDVAYPSSLPVATEPSIALHYRRTDATYSKWTLWLWAKGSDGATYTFNYQDDFGVTAFYPLSAFGKTTESVSLGFIIYYLSGTSWVKDVAVDCFVDFTALTKTDNVYNAYILSGDSTIYTSPDLTKNDVITSALFSGVSTITWSANKKVSDYELDENGKNLASGSLCAANGVVTLPKSASVVNSYVLKLTFVTSQKVLQKAVSTTALYKLTSFDDTYAYDGNDLGAVYASDKTSFKVWSPISSAIVLNLYEKGTPSLDPTPYATYAMTKGDKGVFAVSVEGDLSGKYYTYSVTNQFFNAKEIVDPYAKSCGLNGVRGMVVDFAATDTTEWSTVSAHPYDRKSLVVWETHVADLTSSPTWQGTEAYRKKYLGMVESGTKYTSSTYGITVSTGFDHIKELGVNAVQIMPVFDQANDEANPTFNWGYNPLNYNCLEGVFSNDPADGYARIREFKEVVMKLSEAGINVIMDVVYNHVAGLEGSNFDVLMPGYYFRYNADGSASNGSGCGNETASEMAMFRKFMIDSTGFWAKEYKLGGFRFDLMGLHDLDTMAKVTANLKTINPAICVYGEPWTGGTTTLASGLQAKQANGNSFVGYGAFNDGMRDALIKGGLHASSELGWVTNTSKTSSSDVDSILAGLKGTTLNNGVTIADPDKTTNYVTCHDNYTLRDRLYVSGGISSAGQTLAKVGLLANSFPLLSQGTSFMLSGDEFSRTKQLNSNSYNASYAVNALDYELKARFSNYVNLYRSLIALKTSVDGLHLDASAASSSDVESLVGGEIIKQVFKDTSASKEYVVYRVSGNSSTPFPSLDLTGYSLYLDSLGNDRSGSFVPSPFEVIIAAKAI